MGEVPPAKRLLYVEVAVCSRYSWWQNDHLTIYYLNRVVVIIV